MELSLETRLGVSAAKYIPAHALAPRSCGTWQIKVMKPFYNICISFIQKMGTDNALGQVYYTSHRKAIPRRLTGAATGFWKGIGFSTPRFSNSSSASVSSIEPLDRPESPAMSTPDVPTTPLTNSNGALPHDSPVDTPPPFDTSLFRTYLVSLLPPVLGALPEDFVSMFDEEFDERVTRFAAEGGGVIYVVKTRDEAEGELLHPV